MIPGISKYKLRIFPFFQNPENRNRKTDQQNFSFCTLIENSNVLFFNHFQIFFIFFKLKRISFCSEFQLEQQKKKSSRIRPLMKYVLTYKIKNSSRTSLLNWFWYDETSNPLVYLMKFKKFLWLRLGISRLLQLMMMKLIILWILYIQVNQITGR